MWNYNYSYSSDVLCHHGIKGMKWGVRRFQNRDGTSTHIGKKRRREKSQDHIESRNIKKKKVSEMSNVELQKLNNRMTLENTYQQNARKKNLGKHIIDEIIVGAAVTGITAGLAKNLSKPITKQTTKMVDDGFKVINKYGKKLLKYIWS